MSIKIAYLLLSGCIGLVAATQGHAQYNLRTLPATPIAGQPFSVVIDEDECEEFVPNAPGLPPTFTVDGTAVSLAIDRIEVPDCGSAAVTFSVPVPALPAGNYTLELIGRAFQSPNNFGSLQTVPLSVAQGVASGPATIPASSVWSLTVMVGMSALLAGWVVRRRQ